MNVLCKWASLLDPNQVFTWEKILNTYCDPDNFALCKRFLSAFFALKIMQHSIEI